MQYRKFGENGGEVSVLGYGCMRFPKEGKKIDFERSDRQVRSAIEKGVNYFDTAYVYPGSEETLGKILSNGLRNKVNIATKMMLYMVYSRKDMDNILRTQLERLNIDYIDYYLIHALQSFKTWEIAKAQGMVEFLEDAKRTGVIGHIGFSYHGDKNDFKRIIDDYNWDFCQIQYNYIDENNQAGREGLEYAYSKGIGVTVMEPLKGGNLVGKMPEEIKCIWDKAETKRSYADWALRWVLNQSEVSTVLSGLNEESHIEENIHIASEVQPGSLTQAEQLLYQEVKDVYVKLMKVGCTGCGYCLPCPAGVNIPFCFSCYNGIHLYKESRLNFQYLMFTGGLAEGGKSCASVCKECGKCERVCPQRLPIMKHLKEVASRMEPVWVRPLLWGVGKYKDIRRNFAGK